jgi:hypothetical protein
VWCDGALGFSSLVGLVAGCHHFMAGVGGRLAAAWLVVVDFSRSIFFFFFSFFSSSSSCSPFYTFLFVFAQKMGEGDGVSGL